MCFPPSQCLHPHPRGEQCLSKRGWCGRSARVREWAVAVLDPVRVLDLLLPWAPAVTTLTLLRCHVGSESAPSFTTVHSPWFHQPLCECGAVPRNKRAWSGHLAQAGAQAGARAGAVVGNLSESQTISFCFLYLVSGVSKCVCTFFMSRV